MSATNSNQFSVWQPSTLELLPDEIFSYSRGLMQARLDTWLPTFKSHWQNLFETLGCEVKIIEANFQLFKKSEAEARNVALDVDGESATLCISEALLQLALETLSPQSRRISRDVLVQYLMLRIAGSINNAWAGSEKMAVKASRHRTAAPCSAYLRVVCSINALKTELFFGLSRRLADRLDKIWRRQVHGFTRDAIVAGNLTIALPELSVLRTEIDSYLVPGTVIDMEIPVVHTAEAILNQQPWAKVHLRRSGRHLALQLADVNTASPVDRTIVERPGFRQNRDTLRFEFGHIALEPQLAAELLQPNAAYETNIPLSNVMTITVNQKTVGRAELGTYQNRFAVRVLA